MDSNQDALVAQFSGITGANPTAARTALEQANWNLQEAVGLFYAAQESDGEDDEPQAAAAAAPSQPQPTPSQPAASSSSSRKPPNQSRMKTLRDLQGGGDDDEDEDDRDRDLFAGGEKSGLAVQNPGNTPQDHFRNIMNQARQNAPRAPGGDGDEDEEATPARPSAFTGAAQTLGGDDAPSRTIADPNARPAGAGPRGGRDLPKITRTMHLWADGVSIDDGPLFRFDDPANAQMMQQINRGHAPLSLLDVQPDQEVDLTLDPHRDENYVQPKQKYKPFSGSGNRLGSPTPGPSSSSSTSSAPAPAAAAAPAASSSSSSSAPTNSIDESAPTITLQIRLGDGTRLQSRFNTTQTIGDVYEFVSRAASTTRAYALMTTFPSKELDDKSQVLGDIGDFKRGGVVVQKWK